MGKLGNQIKQLQLWQIEGRKPKLFDPETTQTIHCLNCGSDFVGNYCPNCGQSAKTRRLSLWGVIQDGLQLIGDLDNRLLRTSIELIYRPGYMIRDYIIAGKRQPYLKPLSMLFLMASINLVAIKLFGGNIELTDIDKAELSLQSGDGKDYSLEWIRPFLVGLKAFLTSPALVAVVGCITYLLPNKWLFRNTEIGKSMNYLEHFYLLCYIAVLNMLLLTLEIPYKFLCGMEISLSINFNYSWLLYIWVFKQFFHIRWQKAVRYYVVSTLLMIIISCLIVTLLAVIVAFYLHQTSVI